MNPRVVKVLPEENFRLSIEFDTGEHREFDVTPYLDRGIFSELKDPEYFRKVAVGMGTIQWPNGQDFCPDTLYELSKALA
jgi:hypothetical protein